MEVCAEPDPWNWCWELDRVSSLSARCVCDQERDAATRWSIYSPSWGAIFPDELSQIPTAGSLRPSVLSRLCDYLDWLQRLIISPSLYYSKFLPSPHFLLLIRGQVADKADFECLQSFYAEFSSVQLSSTSTIIRYDAVDAVKFVMQKDCLKYNNVQLLLTFCPFHLKKTQNRHFHICEAIKFDAFSF